MTTAMDSTTLQRHRLFAREREKPFGGRYLDRSQSNSTTGLTMAISQLLSLVNHDIYNRPGHPNAVSGSAVQYNKSESAKARNDLSRSQPVESVTARTTFKKIRRQAALMPGVMLVGSSHNAVGCGADKLRATNARPFMNIRGGPQLPPSNLPSPSTCLTSSTSSPFNPPRLYLSAPPVLTLSVPEMKSSVHNRVQTVEGGVIYLTNLHRALNKSSWALIIPVNMSKTDTIEWLVYVYERTAWWEFMAQM
ncbi:hypothetical protein BDY19DRAFT_910796 [Irpex rosettiformis]|uniref:Uncharacterized protein n=1 Tax=Irpex rosettiformis TaxID=378272 RepID=A0ACB8TMF1_9APHY|nr:hypothetical protein BDY19DRAFT_910796 [Irpex rosettiformis]